MNKYIISAARLNRLAVKCDHETADYRIDYIAKGQADYVMEGASFRAKEGQIVLLSRQTPELAVQASEDIECVRIQIGDLTASELLRRYWMLLTEQNRQITIVSVNGQKEPIEGIFESIFLELEADWDGRNEFLNLLLKELMIRICRANPQITTRGYVGKEKIVSDVKQLLEEKYFQEINLKTIALEYNVSVSRLSHIFKDSTGVPVMRYLLLCRLEAAKKYLLQTMLPINEIAEKCGFRDYSNFSRAFRKETGNTPSQYRQENGKKG